MKKITNFELGSITYFLIRAYFIGLTFNVLLTTAKQDNWICIILGIILGFIPLLIFFYIFNYEPNEYQFETEYTVRRADIDVNNHMHNLNYIELANEALPEEVYKGALFNDVRIAYKKEIKLGDTVKCKYAIQDDKHIVVVKSNDESVVHAIIEMS